MQSQSQSHCIHEEEEGCGRALALGILVAAASVSLGGGLVAFGGLGGDLDGLLDDLRLEHHPDVLVEAAAVHVDEDDGDILVAGLAARDGIRSRQIWYRPSERAGRSRNEGEVTIW